jgi:hypothetical protein
VGGERLKWVLIFIALFFAGTYGWGWYNHVQNGSMSLDGYTRYYRQQVSDRYESVHDSFTGLFDTKPVKRREFNY